MNASSQGIVFLVGAGPGDPGLITMHGLEALTRADVVLYDHLVNTRLLDLAPAGARRTLVGKRSGDHTYDQKAINALLVQIAGEGQCVVRLKGGDPFVFGRGGEEAEALAAAGIPFRVIPGVTAALGASCYAGIPITQREYSSAVAFVSGHDDPRGGALDWQALARFPGTLVLYMACRHLNELASALITAGKDPETPAAFIQRATLPGQRVIQATLEALPQKVAQAGAGPPAMVVIGTVVGRHPELAWFQNLPLFGRTVLVTRPIEESRLAAASLEALGAEVILAPTVEIKPIEDPKLIDQAIQRLPEFHWLVFTSGNGVRAFLERLLSTGRDLRALAGLRIAAIGPATASALGAYHLKPDLLPERFRSEELAEALAPLVKGQRVLLARADRGRTVLRDELLKEAASVEQIAVYRNVDAPSLPPDVQERLAGGEVHWITLTSSAITERLSHLLGPEAKAHIGGATRLASISPVTSETAGRLGWPVAAEASEYTWDGLVRAILGAG